MLIREDNQVEDKTIVYSYDTGGNIKDRKECKYTESINPQELLKSDSYTYGDNNWKNELTQYNDKELTYDNAGNIINDGTYQYAWEKGRQLQSISNNDIKISFKYNSNGIRTEKTVDGVTTKYHVVDGKVTYETNGEDKIYYTYDNGDNLVSMNLNGIEYYYVIDGQENIIGLLDETGKQVVAYSYNSWGKLLSMDGELKDTVGVKNPYRYRGYRYDGETGLYYLQSRYYNPEWGRFINADIIIGQIGNLLSTDLFMYSKNNPINLTDKNGYWAWDNGKKFINNAIIEAGVMFYTGAKFIEDAIVTKVTSLIKNSSLLIKEADSLIQEFIKGNKNPGLGTKNLFKNIYYLRGRNGARVFYRIVNGTMQILGKASKINEQKVINAIMKLYGK